jgi:hypothetical protein
VGLAAAQRRHPGGPAEPDAFAKRDGRSLTFYNLGYPILSLSKDLLLLDEALAYQPDLIVWLVTLDSFAPAQQLNHPLLWHNAPRTRELIQTYQLPLDGADGRFVTPTFWQRTLVGQRQALANWLRLQQLGAAWQATGVDQAIPPEYTPRATDLDADESWQGFETAVPLTAADLAFPMLALACKWPDVTCPSSLSTSRFLSAMGRTAICATMPGIRAGPMTSTGNCWRKRPLPTSGPTWICGMWCLVRVYRQPGAFNGRRQPAAGQQTG